MLVNALAGLLDFLNELEKRKIAYRLEHNRQDSIMVLMAVPGERWEADFFSDGSIELEVFGASQSVRHTTVADMLTQLGEG